MRQERLESGITQSCLAISFGVYASIIDKWEQGLTQPNEYNTN